MFSKLLFSLTLVISVAAFADEKVKPSPSPAPEASGTELIIPIDADEVKEVKIISKDKKTITVYAVDSVDKRMVDGTLLKNPDSEETQKIREEIKASVIANGEPTQRYKVKKGDLEKLETESQHFWFGWGWGWGVPYYYYAAPVVYYNYGFYGAPFGYGCWI